MKVLPSVLLIILSTLLVAFSGIASGLHFPSSGDSRDILVLAIGMAGILVGVLAIKELERINKMLISNDDKLKGHPL
ncbi:hypothetical protein [Simiduia aestuariiviva]|uniref:Uncharacterized protein n=1 Tax=Simiduia aestuariiviva TaxID=1510459 RepID=A0A839USJ7_9GAMM|nr:hypothetical protein [Simiduia aestuariiviva]MBB3169440.1 hypothetical protein [Simiduia aestuariiviva]